jgi:hypothetical protein
MTLDFSLEQWPFLMRTGILEGKENALNVEQSISLPLMLTSRAWPGAISFVLAAFTNSPTRR